MEAHVELSKKLRALLKQNPSLTLDSKKQRIRCSLFGHEMACKEEAVLSYINGKKFQKARARDSSNYDQYKPHIVPSSRRYHEQLFCTLTLRHMNKTPEHVQRHVNGGRYKRALARWRECQEKGIQFVPYQRTFRKVNPEEEPSKDSEDNLGDEDEDEQSASEEEPGTTAEKEELGEDDNFEDLYPAEDFKEDQEEEEDSDFDFDGEDSDDGKKTKPVKSVKASGSKKRKVSDRNKDGEDLNDSKEAKPVQSVKASEAKKRKKEKKKHKKNKKKQITG